jgi:hypothetical protein
MSYKDILKKAKETGKLTDKTVRFWDKPKKDAQLIGELVEIRETESSKGGTYKQHVFKTDSGFYIVNLGMFADITIKEETSIGKVFLLTCREVRKTENGKEFAEYDIQEITE